MLHLRLCQSVWVPVCDSMKARCRGLPVSHDQMIRPEDIADAALEPFRMTKFAVPTGENAGRHKMHMLGVHQQQSQPEDVSMRMHV